MTRRCGPSWALLAAAERARQAIETGESRLCLAAPAVAISYLPGAARRIRAGGRSLAEGEVLRPDQPIVLEIDGIGRIVITPGGDESLDDVRGGLDGHRSTLADLLVRMGVPDIDAARNALEQRRALEAQSGEELARLAALAPEGMPALEAAVGRWQSAASGEARLELPPRADAEAGLALLEDALSLAAESARAAAESRARVDSELVGARARQDTMASRLAALAAQLPAAGRREAALADERRRAGEAEAALNEAVRAVAAWNEAAPSDERFRALEAELRWRTDAVARTREQLAELERRTEWIEGQLARDQADDVLGEAEEKADELAIAEARVHRFESEAAALELLARTLDDVAAASRARIEQPVLQRITPYLSLVLPAAEVELCSGFGVAGLRRNGSAEALAQLSDGTQEQIAVLARLGFGRLMADAGAATPLILDDALVYADDRRIERLFRALELAARSHQVIVLTCRERTFESLGGNRLRLTPWS